MNLEQQLWPCIGSVLPLAAHLLGHGAKDWVSLPRHRGIEPGFVGRQNHAVRQALHHDGELPGASGANGLGPRALARQPGRRKTWLWRFTGLGALALALSNQR